MRPRHWNGLIWDRIDFLRKDPLAFISCRLAAEKAGNTSPLRGSGKPSKRLDRVSEGVLHRALTVFSVDCHFNLTTSGIPSGSGSVASKGSLATRNRQV